MSHDPCVINWVGYRIGRAPGMLRRCTAPGCGRDDDQR